MRYSSDSETRIQQHNLFLQRSVPIMFSDTEMEYFVENVGLKLDSHTLKFLLLDTNSSVGKYSQHRS